MHGAGACLLDETLWSELPLSANHKAVKRADKVNRYDKLTVSQGLEENLIQVMSLVLELRCTFVELPAALAARKDCRTREIVILLERNFRVGRTYVFFSKLFAFSSATTCTIRSALLLLITYLMLNSRIVHGASAIHQGVVTPVL